MPTTIQLLIAAEIILGFLLAVDYLTWRNWNHYRRNQRLAVRNLNRAMGR